MSRCSPQRLFEYAVKAFSVRSLKTSLVFLHTFAQVIASNPVGVMAATAPSKAVIPLPRTSARFAGKAAKTQSVLIIR